MHDEEGKIKNTNDTKNPALAARLAAPQETWFTLSITKQATRIAHIQMLKIMRSL